MVSTGKNALTQNEPDINMLFMEPRMAMFITTLKL